MSRKPFFFPIGIVLFFPYRRLMFYLLKNISAYLKCFISMSRSNSYQNAYFTNRRISFGMFQKYLGFFVKFIFCFITNRLKRFYNSLFMSVISDGCYFFSTIFISYSSNKNRLSSIFFRSNKFFCFFRGNFFLPLF